MKNLLKSASNLMLAVMLLPIALAHVWFRRTYCFYDVPEELKSMLAGATSEVRAFIEKQSDSMNEMKTRMLDVEQKQVRNPSGNFGSNDDVGIITAFEASDGYKSLLKGETKSIRMAIPAKSLQRKAMIGSAISGGSISSADFDSQQIVAPAARKLMLRDLIPSVSTTAGATQYVREVSFTNNAGPQGGATSPTVAGGEGEIKNASDMTLELITSPIITIAHHFTVSRQALDDSAALAQHLDTRGIFGWQLELDRELLLGDGTAGMLDGLVNNAIAFTGGSTNQSALDTARKAITQLSLANHVATGLILNPVDAEHMELLKDTTGQYLATVIYINGVAQVWRVPIIESTAMTAGQFLMGDFTMAARIRDRQEAHVEISLDHLDYRTRNLALVLIEGRIGLEIHRPAALVTGSLSYAG